jgi:hypothetical protein
MTGAWFPTMAVMWLLIDGVRPSHNPMTVPVTTGVIPDANPKQASI